MKVLIAGIGNILMGDDALTSGEFELAILVDAIFRGATPGSLHLIEPAFDTPFDNGGEPSLLALHALNPHRVLSLVAALGPSVPRLLLLACEPRDLGGHEGKLGLSEPVEAAVTRAVMQIFELVGGELTTEDMAASLAPI